MIRNRKTVITLLTAAAVGVGVFAAGVASGQRSQTFTDVPTDAYYHDAAYWAADADITTGCSDDKFCPDDNLTRAQMITFLYRYDTYAANHGHTPDHTHPEREVESDPIRVEGPAGTDQDCSQHCEISLSGFELPLNTVLLVGADIAPELWKFESTAGCRESAVILTKDVRNHPQYPGRATWSRWYNDLLDVRTGIAEHSSDGNDDVAQIFRNSRYGNPGGVSFEVLPHDYAVIYGCT